MTRPTEARTAVRVAPLTLPRPFQFAHATLTSVDIVSLTVDLDGECGTGEIATGLEHGQDSAAIAREAKGLAAHLAGRADPDDVATVAAVLREQGAAVSGPARMVVEMAFLDLAARRAGRPLWRLLDLPDPGTVHLMRTVPIDAAVPDDVRPVKLKLGGPRDAEVLHGLVGVPGPVVLDANRAWSGADWRRLCPLVAEVAPAVLEDPVHVPELLPEIRSALPGTAVVLDEGVESLADAERAAATADGANVKLMRFGGLFPALEALRLLRSAGAAPMLGCYLEPARAIAYAAQLAGLCDWTDLDGHFWLTRTPPVMRYRLDDRVPGIPPIRTA
ncbi:enolase C-terminal domain-like protein [Streptomyces sp. NPDC048057]|uniref:enolase C-terminal domain-like protein n=1 Tax=Streptomyces sp. NPDC048057 TaxID=3155628 RepID=UPI0034109008